MSRRLRAVFPAALAALFLVGCSADEPQVDWVERADLLDQYVISGLTEGVASPVIPDDADKEQIAQRVEAFEDLLGHALDRAWAAPGATEGSLLRLSGIHVGVLLRRLYANEPLETEILSLEGRPGCEVDLVLGRHLARYLRALAAKDDAERLLVLGEWQNGLNCLSAHQAAGFAEGLGAAVTAWETRLREHVTGVQQVERILAAFVQPVLLVVDATKGLLPSSAHFWAKRHADALEDEFASVTRTAWMYDFVSGNLLEIADAAQLGEHLDRLLDPENIGLGTCGFLEMLGSGVASGRFDCGRGLSCGPDPGFGTPISSVPSPRLPEPGELGRFFDRPNLADLDLTSFGADPDSSTVLGVPLGELSDNCGGVGADGSDSGFGGDNLGILGCFFRGAVANAREGDVAYCTLEAMAGAAAQPDSTVIVGGVDPVTGAPVIKGIFGNEECAADPLAQGGEQRTNPVNGISEFKGAVRKAALLSLATNGAWTQVRQSGYLQQVGERMIDSWGANASSSGPRVTRMKNWLSQDLQKPWPGEGVDPSDASVVKSRVTEALDSVSDGDLQDDTLGTYNHSTGEITVDTDKNVSYVNIIITILDEVAHAIERGIKEGSQDSRFGPSEHELHSANMVAMCNISPDTCQLIIDARKEQSKEDSGSSGSSSSGSNSSGGSSTGSGNLPRSPHGPDGGSAVCSALAETMREVMACRGFDDVPPGLTGPGGPGDPPGPIGPEAFREALLGPVPDDGGDVDPSHEQWIASLGSGVFGECMAEYGLGVVGIDGNGVYVIGPDEGIGMDRCDQVIDCPPPGTQMQIGESCRCTDPGGVVLRDLGVMRLCQTSDTCFPNPDLLRVPEIREELEISGGP